MDMGKIYGVLWIPLAWLAGGVAAGLLFEKFIMKMIHNAAVRTRWEGDELVISALRGVVFVWLTAAGAYGAAHNSRIAQPYLQDIDKALLIVIIFSATLAVARLSVNFVSLYSARIGGVFVSTAIFSNLTRVLVFGIGVLIILQSLGISIAPILTALGVGGLAVALALQDTLANLFAGIHVIASEQVRPGDYVKLASGEEGYVQDIAWRYTTIRSLPNNMIIIPNAKLASALVTNYYAPNRELAVLVEVGVDYESDLERVEKVTCEVARDVMVSVEGGVPEFEPFICYHTFSNSSINFTVILRAREFANQYLIKHEFIKKLHQRYGKEGIEIPFPIRTLVMKEKK